MATMDRQWTLREGMTVYGAEGDKVGKIVAVDPGYVVVEKGFFFPTDYYVPTSAIASTDEDKIYLAVSKEEALRQGWDQPLASTAGYATDAAYTTEAVGAEARDRITVPVHEEELQAVTRERERGAVRIEKDVVAEERTLDVPVTEERVRVRQVAADPNAPVDPTAFEEGAIEVPVRGEEVELRKTARQTGAVEVEKEAVQRTERVGGTVRREEVRVEDQTVDAGYVDDATRDSTR